LVTRQGGHLDTCTKKVEQF